MWILQLLKQEVGNSMKKIKISFGLGIIFVITSCLNNQGVKDLVDSTSKTATKKFVQWRPDTQALKKFTRVEIITSLGRLEVALFDATPMHKRNFLALVNSGKLDGMLFHRVIKDFMIQTGDPESVNAPPGLPLGMNNIGEEIDAEFLDTLCNVRGALAAASKPAEINPLRKSSGSQFYIVSAGPMDTKFIYDLIQYRAENEFLRKPENKSYQLRSQSYSANKDETSMSLLNEEIKAGSKTRAAQLKSTYEKMKLFDRYATWGGAMHLDGEQTVFGMLVSGYEVLDAISAVEVGQNSRPVKDVKILSAKIIE